MAGCHVADAGTIALALVIWEFVESGKSIACHSHEFGCEGGWHQHPSKPPSIHIYRGREAIGEPVVWWLRYDNVVPPDN